MEWILLTMTNGVENQTGAPQVTLTMMECGGPTNQRGNEGPSEEDEGANAINEGNGNGKGPRCFNCGGFGHIAVNCRVKGNGKSKGGYAGAGDGGNRISYAQYCKGKGK